MEKGVRWECDSLFLQFRVSESCQTSLQCVVQKLEWVDTRARVIEQQRWRELFTKNKYFSEVQEKPSFFVGVITTYAGTLCIHASTAIWMKMPWSRSSKSSLQPPEVLLEVATRFDSHAIESRCLSPSLCLEQQWHLWLANKSRRQKKVPQRHNASK